MQNGGAIERFGPPDETASSRRLHDVDAPDRSGVRRAYDIAVNGYLVAFVTQLLLAGWSLFNEPARWDWHRALGHSLELVALVMVVLAVAGRTSRSTRLLTIAVLLLTIVQGAVAGIGGWVGAVHPVTGFTIGVLVYRLSQRR